MLKEEPAEYRKKENHLELRKERKHKKHRGKHRCSATRHTVNGAHSKHHREQIHLSPNGTRKQKGRIQGDKTRECVPFPFRIMEPVHKTTKPVQQKHVRKVNGPEAHELHEKRLADTYTEQIMNMRHNPEPKNIDRRVIPPEVPKAPIHELLSPAHPETLVTVIALGIRTKDIRQ